MSILTRFKDIMSANINAMLDSMEDPEKMIDQCLRNLHEDLGTIKSETATVMAEEKRALRVLNDAKEEVVKLENYAIKALQNNNETDAKSFLSEKSTIENTLPNLQQTYDISIINATNMRKMHDKLVEDVNELNNKKSMLKAKFATAKAQQHINDTISRASNVSANNTISAFQKYEEVANQALDKAAAMAELNGVENDVEDLKTKYDSHSADIDMELEKLKARIKQD